MSRRRKQSPDYEPAVPMIRMMLGYLCLVALFGSVLLVVHAAIEVKRTFYHIGDRSRVKEDLISELRSLDATIMELERYDRIQAKVAEHLPQLGPPRHPAIAIQVPGLETHRGVRVDLKLPDDETSWILNMRDQWRETGASVKQWLERLKEPEAK